MPKNKKTEQETQIEELEKASKAPQEGEALTDVDGSVSAGDELRKELEQARKKAEEYLDAARRIQAEFDNYRKRNAQLRSEASDDGAREVVLSLLGVYDNLERAVQAADEAGDASAIAEGVRMCAKVFVETLNRLGVTPIDACEGAPFDPNVHDAVLTVEPDVPSKEGTVAEALQKGYMMRDKVLRVAMVKVYH